MTPSRRTLEKASIKTFVLAVEPAPRIMLFKKLLLCSFLLMMIMSKVVHGRPARRVTSRTERLHRLLEKRQIHEYEADKSYRNLLQQGYDVWAGHFRQLRSLAHRHRPRDRLFDDLYQKEHDRMESFVTDVREINMLTDNRLYQQLGSVKDRTFDDLIAFLHSEIRNGR